MSRIAFAWPAGSYHGWGVIGLNLLLSWPGEALSLSPELSAELGPTDTRYAHLTERVGQSMRLQRDLAEHPSLAAPVMGNTVMWVASGNNFLPGVSLPVTVDRDIAFPVFEDLAMAERNLDNLRPYRRVIAASRFNLNFLRSHGIDATLCHQGYDPVLFHPGVRRKRDDGRFRVFSGGKAEWRKGQDLVLRAFSRFAKTHDDAVLVAAWGSPWPGIGQSFAEHGIEPPPGSHIGMPNYRAWASLHGIPQRQIEIVSPTPNWQMPTVYGGVDVAVFPNRVEGGTNLVAMELMGCGVPVILSATTGQLDLGKFWRGSNWPYIQPDDDAAVESIVAGLHAAYDGSIYGGVMDPYWHWPARWAELREILEA